LVLGLVFFAISVFGSSAITDLEPFVLVAENSIHLAGDTQISSGDIASNKDIRVSENSIANSNLFSDRIQLASNVSINGNATFNKLIKAQTAEVLGEEIRGIDKNIVELPQIHSFQTGNENVTVEEGQETTIGPGNYNQIEVGEGATLTLNPGTYNLNRLTLQNNSKLLYLQETTLNIKTHFQTQNSILIAPASPAGGSNNPNSNSTTELSINYIGRPPITIGDSSFITAKILAPTSRVHLGNRATFRGQIFASDIQIGEEAVLSREAGFEKESDLNKIIELPTQVRLVANEIVIFLVVGSDINALLDIANLVNGQVTGFLSEFDMGKIEVETTTFLELEILINKIKDSNNPLIEDVLPNALVF